MGEAAHPSKSLPYESCSTCSAADIARWIGFGHIAWSLFGGAPMGSGAGPGRLRLGVTHVRFDYQYRPPYQDGYDVFVERYGVCRDFNHLALTFCRCLYIPARYAPVISATSASHRNRPDGLQRLVRGLPRRPWYTFDARHNVPRIGRVLMARGRDAVDVAMTTSFGNSTLTRFTVWTDEVPAW